FALGGYRRLSALAAADECRVRRPGLDPLDPRLDLLADEFCRVRDDDVEAVELRDGSARIEQIELDRLQVDARALGHRPVRRDRLELALRRHEEVVEMDVRNLLEEEAALGRGLDVAEARRAGSGDERCDPVVELNAKRLHARASGEL